MILLGCAAGDTGRMLLGLAYHLLFCCCSAAVAAVLFQLTHGDSIAPSGARAGDVRARPGQLQHHLHNEGAIPPNKA